jgi:hypothetical protein
MPTIASWIFLLLVAPRASHGLLFPSIAKGKVKKGERTERREMVVPHFFQSNEQACGAACLRMLFAAFGVAHDETTIAHCCGLTALGCTVQELVTGAQALNFNAAMLTTFGEPAALAALSHETPFVAMIDLASLHKQMPMFQWHFAHQAR